MEDRKLVPYEETQARFEEKGLRPPVKSEGLVDAEELKARRVDASLVAIQKIVDGVISRHGGNVFSGFTDQRLF